MKTDLLVILQPRSITNPSSKFRLVRYSDWMAFVNKKSRSYGYWEYATYDAADDARTASGEPALWNTAKMV